MLPRHYIILKLGIEFRAKFLVNDPAPSDVVGW
jgi:hypothetical protein